MNNRGGSHFGGCMLMNSRGGPPHLERGLPLGTISMDLAVLNNWYLHVSILSFLT